MVIKTELKQNRTTMKTNKKELLVFGILTAFFGSISIVSFFYLVESVAFVFPMMICGIMALMSMGVFTAISEN